MVRKNYTPEQIINKLREAEIHINRGIPIAEARRKIGITEQTYYRIHILFMIIQCSYFSDCINAFMFNCPYADRDLNSLLLPLLSSSPKKNWYLSFFVCSA